MRLDQFERIVVDGAAILVIETGLEARHRKERVVLGVIGKQGLDGAGDSFGLEQGIGAVRLEVEIRLYLCCVVEQDIVHGDVVSAEMLGTGNQLHGREEAAHAVHHRLGVGVHHHRLDLRDGEQGLEDVVKKRLSRQRTVIFARHALAVMAHGNEGGETRHGITWLCWRTSTMLRTSMGTRAASFMGGLYRIAH